MYIDTDFTRASGWHFLFIIVKRKTKLRPWSITKKRLRGENFTHPAFTYGELLNRCGKNTSAMRRALTDGTRQCRMFSIFEVISPRSVVCVTFNIFFSLIINFFNFYKNFSSVANCFLFSSFSFYFLEYFFSFIHLLITAHALNSGWILNFQLWIPHFYAVSFSLYSIRRCRHWVSPRIYFDS